MRRKIRLISINCFGVPLFFNKNNRLAVLISEIIKYKPNIVCLQEVSFSKDAAIFSKELARAGYDVFYSPRAVFNSGGLLVAAIFPMTKKEFIRFVNQGSLFSLQITDRFLGKGYQKVELLIGKRKTMLFNTHIVCVYKRNSQQEKQSQEEQFHQLVKDIGKSERTILTGDLNFSPKEPLYSELIRKTSLVDPNENTDLITVSRKNTNKKGFYKSTSDVRVDYTLVSGDMVVTKQQIIFKNKFKLNGKWIHFSDHFGLLSEVKI